jgi:hypothetical protein
MCQRSHETSEVLFLLVDEGWIARLDPECGHEGVLAAVLNNFLLVPIAVIPVTLFAWWRYWAADRSSENGDR